MGSFVIFFTYGKARNDEERTPRITGNTENTAKIRDIDVAPRVNTLPSRNTGKGLYEKNAGIYLVNHYKMLLY